MRLRLQWCQHVFVLRKCSVSYLAHAAAVAGLRVHRDKLPAEHAQWQTVAALSVPKI